eukprot:CAMPEP_0174380328 /NCGR_PEP_ID=MMETSP0811_2-20130205/123290_1 /TAXON_ID=73025 ORGANISM="Eutreptiella gymnastica-like, Strain CCMP1594" /NCGR_SAMPLE_ID=MMETSP0811_2 /ASSEMBLY_ACC=CAM_ASM_000667 /LENGTH=212 /DNA_ID=CAMNT_0015533159 /DNA_START=3903 /DNA_END=4542 /DNA_ORIENTATION=+
MLSPWQPYAQSRIPNANSTLSLNATILDNQIPDLWAHQASRVAKHLRPRNCACIQAMTEPEPDCAHDIDIKRANTSEVPVCFAQCTAKAATSGDHTPSTARYKLSHHAALAQPLTGQNDSDEPDIMTRHSSNTGRGLTPRNSLANPTRAVDVGLHSLTEAGGPSGAQCRTREAGPNGKSCRPRLGHQWWQQQYDRERSAKPTLERGQGLEGE